MIKMYTLLVIMFASEIASGQIYKCTGANGKQTFSDKPCSKGATQEEIESKKKEAHWIGQLKEDKPSSVEIISITQQEEDTFVHYIFEHASDSTEFIRLAYKISDMNVSLIKITKPKGSTLGRAKMKISSQPNPLLDRAIIDK